MGSPADIFELQLWVSRYWDHCYLEYIYKIVSGLNLQKKSKEQVKDPHMIPHASPFILVRNQLEKKQQVSGL